MQMVLKGDTSVKTLVGHKKTIPGLIYRWSDFVFPFSHLGKRYVFNNLTKRCYCIDEQTLNTEKNARFTSESDIKQDVMDVLVADLFLVPEDKDETQLYEGFLKIARAMRRSKGYSSYTILPTTACNARCVYCFELGYEYVSMKAETAERLIQFIIETHNPKKKVELNWFGGEPLVGEKIIDKICEGLRNAGVDYTGYIVTNASLISAENIKKMQSLWNVQEMQITLDGAEDEYNARKNYYHHYPSAYWHVLSRIKMVNEAGIFIYIRVNIDSGNIGGLRQMFSELEPFVPDKKNVVVLLTPLFQVQESLDGLSVWNRCFDLFDFIQSLGFRLQTMSRIRELTVQYCMADSPDRCVVIGPDGRLYPCESIEAMPSLGNIWDGVTNQELYNELSQVEKTAEKCKGCVFLPDCTPFSKCENFLANCKTVREKYLLFSLNRKLSQLENGAGNDTEDNQITC